jgi:intracellular multiplication protein IcmE
MFKLVPVKFFLAGFLLALTGISAGPCHAQQAGGYYTQGMPGDTPYTPPGNAAPPPPPATATPQQPMAPVKTIISAGSIATAQLLNDLNSDIPGPVLAQVTSGPFAGGRAIGSFSRDLIGDNGYITVTFTRIVKDDVVYNVQATALDQNSTLAGLRSNVDHHYRERLTLPATADFIKGYSQAMSTVGTSTITTAGGGVASSTPASSPRQAIMQGVEGSSGQVANQLQQDANVPVTVSLARGTGMNLLFTQSVTTGNVGQ